MSTPKSPEELTKQIEQLVAQYVEESRRAVREAVERGFGASPSPSRPSKAPPTTRGSRKPPERRRPPEEVAQIGARLLELVRARPGESMVVFAAELELGVRDLQGCGSGPEPSGCVVAARRGTCGGGELEIVLSCCRWRKHASGESSRRKTSDSSNSSTKGWRRFARLPAGS
jgi:hypothetical protein